ncbi:MAG: hypothetical protein ACREX3_14560 [Gammaproteobacteria bacterium]
MKRVKTTLKTQDFRPPSPLTIEPYIPELSDLPGTIDLFSLQKLGPGSEDFLDHREMESFLRTVQKRATMVEQAAAKRATRSEL